MQSLQPKKMPRPPMSIAQKQHPSSGFMLASISESLFTIGSMQSSGACSTTRHGDSSANIATNEDFDFKGRSIYQPETLWPLFRPTTSDRTYVTQTWNDLHKRKKVSNMASILAQTIPKQ